MLPEPTILYPGGPALGPISLGGATFGREIDEAAAFALMDHGAALGITLLDTAATYSDGVSERIIGAWRVSRRIGSDTLGVETKIYPPFTPGAIDTAVTASARRLGVDSIDLLYLHRWHETASTVSALTALDGLIRDGRVRALGVSNFNAAQLRAILARQQELGLHRVRAIQNNNNLAVRDVDPSLQELCAAGQVAILTYSPLGAGFLTGKHQRGVEPGSRFAVSPAHQDVYFHPVAQGRLARLFAVSARTGLPAAHLALAWALHRPYTASVVIGGRIPAHLDQACAALQLNAPAIFAELESV